MAIDDKHAKVHDAEAYSETSSLDKGDLLSREHLDPVLNAKMHLVNDVCLCPISPQTPLLKLTRLSSLADH